MKNLMKHFKEIAFFVSYAIIKLHGQTTWQNLHMFLNFWNKSIILIGWLIKGLFNYLMIWFLPTLDPLPLLLYFAALLVYPNIPLWYIMDLFATQIEHMSQLSWRKIKHLKVVKILSNIHMVFLCFLYL